MYRFCLYLSLSWFIKNKTTSSLYLFIMNTTFYFVVSCRTEQLSLLSQQHIVVTFEDSELRTEMDVLESQEEDDPKCILFFQSSLNWWVGWDRSGLTVEMKPGLIVSGRLSLTRPWASRSRSSLKSLWRLVEKFQLDTMGDHLCTFTIHSGAKKAHDWVVDQLTDLFRLDGFVVWEVPVWLCRLS